MAGNAEQAGSSLKRRSPGVQARASDANTLGREREMNNNTAVSVVTPETMPAISHAGRPVVTTALLARLYGTEAKRIQNNYMRNADRFEQGKHFFKLEGKELTDLRPSMGGSQISAKARSLMLWTERGAARHAKMLETNEAWDVFERLEDCYFGAVEPEKTLSTPASQTLIGTTIGTDGFRCLAAVLDGKLRNLKGGAKRAAKNHVWQQVHRAFSVVSAEAIPAAQLDSVRNFIAAYDVREGEFIGKQQDLKVEPGAFRRYLVSFDHNGKQQMSGVPAEACVMTVNQMLSAISDPEFPVSTEELFDFMAAVNSQLKRRAAWQAAQLKRGRAAA